MASKLKRRADTDSDGEDEEWTPIGKRSRPTAVTLAGRKGKKAAQGESPKLPVFVVEDEATENSCVRMPGTMDASKSLKPLSAEEFKAMLREGLANVAKKEQIDMMTQIKGNAESLQSLEKKVDTNYNIAERRFKEIEEKIQQPGWPSTWDHSLDHSKEAAFNKSRRSLRAWPITGDDPDELNAAFRDFALTHCSFQTLLSVTQNSWRSYECGPLLTVHCTLKLW